MIKYKIAIPSYKRAKTLQSKTLSILVEAGYEMENIFIFVADVDQKLEYETVLQGFPAKNIIVAIKGMKNVRNFMTDYFGSSNTVVYIDDDIESFHKLGNKKLLKLTGQEIQSMVEELIAKMFRHNCFFGGNIPRL
jgi:hypothetical protein